MSQNAKQGSLGSYAAVAIVALLIGRCSVGGQGGTSVETVAASRAPAAQAFTTDLRSSVESGEAPTEAFGSTSDGSDAAEVADVGAVEDRAPVYYRNCSAARAAGAAPVHSDEPGYAPHLDRDGDGVGCE